MNPDALSAIRRDIAAAMESAADFVERPASEHYQAAAGDGAVIATVGVGGQLLDVRITPQARRGVDNLTLGEHVRDAIRAAEAEAEQARTALLGSLTIGGRSVADILADPGAGLPGTVRPRRQR
ncbi:YbaB/EbfC family nucleoid-associated protein [Micromonospora sp. NPDC005220]|uniref:YbaB/EbfC family nucleoid-associated protein n=1 Tax=Micromonospora sp. NPDC005220 TaxID=3155589 RepID=UPI0033B4ACEE